MAASATFALKSGEWFRRVRFVIFAPDSHAQPCALSGRDSTHRTDRNSGATSHNSFAATENGRARRRTAGTARSAINNPMNRAKEVQTPSRPPERARNTGGMPRPSATRETALPGQLSRSIRKRSRNLIALEGYELLCDRLAPRSRSKEKASCSGRVTLKNATATVRYY